MPDTSKPHFFTATRMEELSILQTDMSYNLGILKGPLFTPKADAYIQALNLDAMHIKGAMHTNYGNFYDDYKPQKINLSSLHSSLPRIAGRDDFFGGLEDLTTKFKKHVAGSHGMQAQLLIAAPQYNSEVHTDSMTRLRGLLTAKGAGMLWYSNSILKRRESGRLITMYDDCEQYRDQENQIETGDLATFRCTQTHALAHAAPPQRISRAKRLQVFMDVFL